MCVKLQFRRYENLVLIIPESNQLICVRRVVRQPIEGHVARLDDSSGEANLWRDVAEAQQVIGEAVDAVDEDSERNFFVFRKWNDVDLTRVTRNDV